MNQEVDPDVEEALAVFMVAMEGAYKFLDESVKMDRDLYDSFSRIPSGREWYITPRDAHFVTFTLFNETLFLEADFRAAFRMTRASAERLHTLLQPFISKQKTRFRDPIPSRNRLLVFLYHVSKPASYSVVSNLFSYGKSTISEIIRSVSLAIVENLREQYIRWPTQHEMNTTADIFRTKYGIPQCVGCVDGCHFPIKRPVLYGDTYFNRKGFYSINGQAIVNHRRAFIDIWIGFPGNTADGRVWRHSNVGSSLNELFKRSPNLPVVVGVDNNRREITKSLPPYILGDSAYPNEKHLVTTYEMNQILADPITKILNRKLGGMRYLVECAFGILKNRFRILSTPLESATKNTAVAIDLITALLILHNFLIYEGDNMEMDIVELSEFQNENQEINNDENGDEPEELGRSRTRDILYDYVSYLKSINEI